MDSPHPDRIHDLALQIAQGLHGAGVTPSRTLALRAVVGCYVTSDACFTYEDDVVCIVMHKHNLSGVIYRQENKNPVASWEAGGASVRWHGEIYDIYEHMVRLASPLTLIARRTALP